MLILSLNYRYPLKKKNLLVQKSEALLIDSNEDSKRRHWVILFLLLSLLYLCFPGHV